MTRADEGMAFLLRYENVAWYEDGQVRILDRRIYPIRTEYVVCKRHEEVAEGFADDNPLAGSASYQVFLHDITLQDQVVAYLQQLKGR